MASARGTSKYWVNQMVICGVAAVLLFAYGVLVMMFGGTCIWLVRSYWRMSVTQHAVYAWAIMQQHSTGTGSDVDQMSIAGQAAAGTLPYPHLQWLQALDPANPYPAEWPSEPTMPTTLLPE